MLSHDETISKWLSKLRAQLENRRAENLFRSLSQIESASAPEIIVAGKRYLQFCSNNYLGLAGDPEVIDAARAATAKYGTGSGASRLVSGSLDLHHQLEAILAEWKKSEAALIFPAGFMANLAVLTTLAGATDRIVSDKLNHASLIDAAEYSGAEHRTFPHLNYERALELLTKAPKHQDTKDQQKFLVTDTVFSMDGDIADLPAACNAAAESGALVITDEAHATGVLGDDGSGLAEMQNEKRIAVSIGTLSKALGTVGGFVTAPRAVIETLINLARPFIYTTALPASASAAAIASIAITRRDPARRQRVLKIAAHVKRELESLGFDCGNSATPIIPVMMKDSVTALTAAAFLKDRNIWVPAIRPPTVKEPRLRISLMATHTDSQIQALLDAMRKLPR